jgi:hypothetical protein
MELQHRHLVKPIQIQHKNLDQQLYKLANWFLALSVPRLQK